MNISWKLYWAVAFLIVGTLTLPLGSRFLSNGAPAEKASLLVNLSLRQYREKKFVECTRTAQAAIDAFPSYAEAWNNLSVCEIELKHYDEAIKAARNAVRLRPDFQLARNNLAWAIELSARK